MSKYVYGCQGLKITYKAQHGVAYGVPMKRIIMSLMIGLLASAMLMPLQAHAIQGKIFSGSSIEDNTQFPFMANLFKRDTNTIYCGAVLIDERYLLTAAHCAVGFTTDEIAVALGDPQAQAEVLEIESVWASSQFRWPSLTADYAILRLVSPIESVTPVSLASKVDVDQLTNGQLLTVLGWGQVSQGSRVQHNLREAQVPYVVASECEMDWARNFPTVAERIDQELICAGGQSAAADTCAGDSGGPLLTSSSKSPISQEYTLIGLTSFGEPVCGGALKPSIYSRVDDLQTDIQRFKDGLNYYSYWQDGFTELAYADAAKTIEVRNNTSDYFDILAFEPIEKGSFSIGFDSNTCSGVRLGPNQTCELQVGFLPQSAGFHATSIDIPLADGNSLNFNLQGYGFERVPSAYFGDQGIEAFIGGDTALNLSNEQGVSNGGRLQITDLPPLDSSEIFVSTVGEVSQKISIFVDFIPAEGSTLPPPIVTIQGLGDGSNLDQILGEDLILDTELGWQSRELSVIKDEFTNIQITASGQGAKGQIVVDFATEQDSVPNNTDELQVLGSSLNQSTQADQSVQLMNPNGQSPFENGDTTESGASWWLAFFGASVLALRRLKTKIFGLYTFSEK